MPFFDELKEAVSEPRIERYRPPNGSGLETATTYFWNMALCEALYPVLNTLEVTLRNSIHRTATQIYDSEYWFDLPGVLKQKQPGQVQAARGRLTERGRPHRRSHHRRAPFWLLDDAPFRPLSQLILDAPKSADAQAGLSQHD